MIVILGLVILVAAVVIGVLGNGGNAQALHHGFAVFGYRVTGSAGTLALDGILAGAVGLLGLSVLLGGVRRTSRRGSAAHRGLRQSRLETAAASQQRDDLIDERDTARATRRAIWSATRLEVVRSPRTTASSAGCAPSGARRPPPPTQSRPPARPRPISQRRRKSQR